MANFYYSGQGSLYIATKNATTGEPEGFIPIGNVPSLTIDIATTLFEHKESESGQRLIDLVIVKEKKGTFTYTLENLSLENLALGLWGTSTVVTAGTVTAPGDSIIIPQNGSGRRYKLAHPEVSSVIVKDVTDTTTYVLTTDYTVDADNGMLIIPTSGAIHTACQSAAVTLHVTYSYGGNTKLDAFMNAAAPERWLRFEGINTVDGKKVIIDIFRAQFDPMTGYALLNEDLGSVEMKGTVLADSTRATGSKFFLQTNLG